MHSEAEIEALREKLHEALAEADRLWYVVYQVGTAMTSHSVDPKALILRTAGFCRQALSVEGDEGKKALLSVFDSCLKSAGISLELSRVLSVEPNKEG